jgi:hypothetical protein
MEGKREDEPDLEFERLVEAAQRGEEPSWDSGDVLLNSAALVISLVTVLLLAPYSFLAIPLLCIPLSWSAISTENTVELRQVSRSILLGFLLSTVYFVMKASGWKILGWPS